PRRAAESGRAAAGLRVRPPLRRRPRGLHDHLAVVSSRGGRPRRPLSPRRLRRPVMRRVVTLLLAAVLSLSWTDPVLAQGTLRIGMTASDIPYTGGQTDNGFEGFRFVEIGRASCRGRGSVAGE